MTLDRAIEHFEKEVRFCERAPAGNIAHQTVDWVMAMEANRAALAALIEKRMRESTVYRTALDTFGAEAQIKKLFEEIGEFMDALCKCSDDRDTVTHLAEEIADLEIMLRQMAVLFDCEDDVERQRQYKLQRLAGRIEEVQK